MCLTLALGSAPVKALKIRQFGRFYMIVAIIDVEVSIEP